MKKYFQSVLVRYLVFGVLLVAVTIGIGYMESNNKVKAFFGDTSVTITSKKYSMNIPYELVDYAELVQMPDAGEVVDGQDSSTIRTGIWNNDTWGEHYVCLDPDTTNCIAVHLDDGRIFVFSRKNDEETAYVYEMLQTYLTQE